MHVDVAHLPRSPDFHAAFLKHHLIWPEFIHDDCIPKGVIPDANGQANRQLVEPRIARGKSPKENLKMMGAYVSQMPEITYPLHGK